MQGVREWGAAEWDGLGCDAEAVHSARSGDRSAFEVLVRPHQRSLFVLCCGMLGSRDDAEDAVQETMYRALRGISRFCDRSSIKTWLFRIAKNVCLEWKRRPNPPVQLAVPEDAAGDISPESSVLRSIEIMRALQSLPNDRRALMIVREAEGWSIPEIASAFGWSEKKVENELYRARRSLAEWGARVTERE